MAGPWLAGHQPACGQVCRPEPISDGQGGSGMHGCQGPGEAPEGVMRWLHMSIT